MSLCNTIQGAFHKARDKMHETKKQMTHAHEKTTEVRYVDLTVQFIGASGLPKLDVVGIVDPYIVARVNDKLRFM